MDLFQEDEAFVFVEGHAAPADSYKADDGVVLNNWCLTEVLFRFLAIPPILASTLAIFHSSQRLFFISGSMYLHARLRFIISAIQKAFHDMLHKLLIIIDQLFIIAHFPLEFHYHFSPY